MEDSLLLAESLALFFEAEGFRPVGPYSRISEALEAVERGGVDVAILDVDLGREGTSLPVAERLDVAGIPIVFLTGRPHHIPPHLRNRMPVVAKPHDMGELLATVMRLVQREEETGR
ncbi:MAG: hypothetical protein ACOY4R_12035 [Pseudomonadota bacterium]